MAQAGVNYDLVVNAAEAVLRRGENPTIERVRRELGGTGSNTTINKYLSQWKTKKLLANSNQTANNATANSIKPDFVNEAVGKIWNSLQGEAENKIKELEESYQEKVDKLLHVKDELAAELKSTKEEFLSLTTDYNTLVELKSKLDEDLATNKSHCITLESQIDNHQNILNTLKEEREKHIMDAVLDKEEKINALQVELKELYNDYNTNVDRLKDEMETKRHEYIVKLENAKVNQAKLEQENEWFKANLAEKLNAKNQDLSEFKQQINALTAIVKDVADKNQTFIEVKELYETRNINLKNDNYNLKKENSNLTKDNEKLLQQTERLTKEIQKLQMNEQELKLHSNNLQNELRMENQELKNQILVLNVEKENLSKILSQKTDVGADVHDVDNSLRELMQKINKNLELMKEKALYE